MRHLVKIFIIGSFVFSCSNNNIDTVENQELTFSLQAPNGEILANNIEELSERLSSSTSNLEILDIAYFDVEQKGQLAALVQYRIYDEVKKVIIARNMEHFNFEKGSVLGFQSQAKMGDGVDLYISCSGGSCCYPNGTYDPDKGTITTSCKCDSGNNSQCIMKISETPPENN